MVQFNLLPDVKLQYVKARRTKYLMTFVALVVGGVSIAVLLFSLFFVHVVQSKSLSDLNADIKDYSTQLKNVDNLSQILTVQNQLNTLTELHQKKPVASRLFGYLAQVTPSQVSLTKLSVDFTANTMAISGKAPTLDAVGIYTDTLKGTKYTTDDGKTTKNAFSDVVLSNFGRDDKGATFTITLTFDPVLFDSTQPVKLIVPADDGVNLQTLFTTGK